MSVTSSSFKGEGALEDAGVEMNTAAGEADDEEAKATTKADVDGGDGVKDSDPVDGWISETVTASGCGDDKAVEHSLFACT